VSWIFILQHTESLKCGRSEPVVVFAELFECLQIVIDTDQKMAICPTSMLKVTPALPDDGQNVTKKER
jgi:hypothetical protein